MRKKIYVLKWFSLIRISNFFTTKTFNAFFFKHVLRNRQATQLNFQKLCLKLLIICSKREYAGKHVWIF